MRYLGVDLHKTNFVVCFLSDDETTRTETYPLTKAGITRFVAQLESEDQVAVEVTSNIYYFYDQVKAHVSRVVLVDTYRFAVIAQSKKKTDRADAAALARFLKLDYLPSVPVPSERVRQLRHLLQARETLVGMRTKLKNMAHSALTRNGIALSRSAFASRLSRARLAKRDELAPADALIMQAALRQIEELDREIEAIGAEIVRIGKGLAGVKRLLQVHGMNLLSAISLLAEIGDIHRFETSKQLTAYAGLATSTRQSNEEDAPRRDHQARAKAAAHGCDQCRTVDGQSDADATDGVLSEKEERERGRQGHLCDGEETADDHLRDAEEGVGLLVLGRSLVQSQVAVA